MECCCEKSKNINIDYSKAKTINLESHNLSEIVNEIRTGDLIMFSGISIFSYVIRASTMSIYSHCGIIYIEPSTNEITVIHSVSDNSSVCIDTNFNASGVVRSRLSDIIDSGYYDTIDIYKVNRSINISGNELMKIYKHYMLKSYEIHLLELMGSALDCKCSGVECIKNRRNEDSFFCSELVATIYEKLGLVKLNDCPNEYTPYDVTSFGIFDDLLIIKPKQSGFFGRLCKLFLLH
jgi:hypothetical protein